MLASSMPPGNTKSPSIFLSVISFILNPGSTAARAVSSASICFFNLLCNDDSSGKASPGIAASSSIYCHLVSLLTQSFKDVIIDSLSPIIDLGKNFISLLSRASTTSLTIFLSNLLALALNNCFIYLNCFLAKASPFHQFSPLAASHHS